MNIGKILRRIRIKKGISKNELCIKTGLNKGYVYRLENDLISPTLTTLEKVAGALGESLSEVVKLSEIEQGGTMYTDISTASAWGEAADDPEQ